MSKGVQIAVGATLIAGLLGWYATTNIEGSGTFRYYQNLDEFRATGDTTGAARVHGYVKPGTIQRDVEARVVRFAVQNDPPHAGATGSAEALAVVYLSLETPDLFRDGAEVVVEGRLSGEEGVFHATNVLAKCPSKFEAKQVESASF
jgi:cytochrome c-type biogenesis protein CcmE